MSKRTMENSGAEESCVNRKMSKSNIRKSSEDVEVLELPVTSASDKKDYRLIRIKKNKMMVMLISHAKLLEGLETNDKTADEEQHSEFEQSEDEATGSEDEFEDDEGESQEKAAAAALCVDAGSFHDPQSGVHGMAHFVEHMVFMGSEKYPDENAFDKHITTFGGSNNAMTEHEHTVFYFEITEKGFEGALDRLSNFFISPLMKKDSMNREREAVESEFQNRIDDDTTRLDQLIASLGQSSHPCSTFAWGNLKTLKDNISDDDLYERAHEFRKKHYVGNKMYLCMQSRESLETLQDLAVKYFSDVPYKADVDAPLSTNPEYSYTKAFKPEFHEKMYFIKPKSNRIKMNLTWLLPSMLKDYREKPQHFVSFVLGFEGPGSLCSYLRKNLLALGVTTGASDLTYDCNSLFTLFTISITLTDYGLKNVEKVLEAVFSYLLLLEKSEPSESLFKELQQIEENSFRFQEEKSSDDNVEETVILMKYFPPKDIFTGLELYFDYDKDKIASVIKALNQPNFNLMLLTEKYQFDKVEKWFGTEYAEVDFPVKYKELWANRKLMNDFFLPEKNPYICSDFEIFFKKDQGSSNPLYPEKIFENDYCECWYRLDDKFLLPNGYIYVYLITPEMLKSAYSFTLMTQYALLLKHYLAETLYPAYVAGLESEIVATQRGLMIKANGYNEKVHMLIEIIVNNMKNFSKMFEISAFETYKKQVKKNAYNVLIESHKLNKELRISMVDKIYRNSYELYNEIDNVKFEDLKQFSIDWLKELQIKILVQGNMKRENCLAFTANLLKNLDSSSQIKDKSVIFDQARRIPEGRNYLKVISMLPGNKNSTITNYYQIGESSIKLHCLLDLFVMIMEEPVFNILRTEEQLGYAVHAIVRDNSNVLGFSITIMSQEDKNPMKVVDDKMEDFVMQKMAKILGEIGDEEFETTKQSLIKLKSMIDTDLKAEFSRNWGEITSDEYLFDRREREIGYLSKLQKSDILDFYNKKVKIENSRKLSVQVIGCNEKIVSLSQEDDLGNHKIHLEYMTDKFDDQHNVISDINEFKNSLEFYPVLKTQLD